MKWFESIKRPIIGLAPMHSVSKSELRLLCRKSGADVVYSEMVASEAIIRKVPQAYEMMKFEEGERPIIIQIFGHNPQTMAQAAKIVENDFHPDGIDINFGCPVQKAAKQGFGAIQLSDIAGASAIVKSVKSALKNTPLSIKIRLVSKDIQDTVDFLTKMESCGIDMVAIHGRTPTQKYGGHADWKSLVEIKKHFPDLIILGSGDIDSLETLKEKIGNLDGALIGRAAKRNPNIFSELSKIK
jgi:tRNA-dihydrouridine synthase